MNDDQPSYFAYLLRVWRADDGAGPEWRASLESPHSADRRGFSSLKALFGFLEELTENLIPEEPRTSNVAADLLRGSSVEKEWCNHPGEAQQAKDLPQRRRSGPPPQQM